MRHLSIDHSNGIPIYVQLKEKIKYAIATNVYPPGAKLPTVRSLAVELKINVNTVSKVYSELEREGILATMQGRGTFVRDVALPEKELKEQRVKALTDQIMISAHEMGIAPEKLLDLVRKKLQER